MSAFLTASDTSEALAAAMDLDHEVREIANGKRKPGRLSLEKLAIVLSFVREQSKPAPREAIGKLVAWAMDAAVENGANSVSMPDELVEIAAWLDGVAS